MEVYAEGAQIKHERQCPDCRGKDFVEDHAAGDIVCRGCGLVVEAHIIDERSEWRTFGDKDREGDDPSRVGAATNPLMDNGGLSTSIGKLPGGAGGQFNMLMKLHNRQTGSDRQMQAASREINEICERLRLPDVVKNSALEVFKDTQEFKTLKGRSNRAVYAACIFVAGKRESSHRTFKEICAVMGSDVDKVDIGRCFTAIDKMYKNRAQYKAKQAGVDLNEVKGGLQHNKTGAGAATRPEDVIKRFMSRLTPDKKLNLFAHRVAKRAAEVAAEEAVPWAARDPSTQACALMYGVMQIHKLQNPNSEETMVTWEQLSASSGMAPNTIRDCYKMMLPYLAVPGKLVAESDAKADVLAQLEAAFRAAPAPGGDSKAAAAKKAAAAAAAAGGGGR